MALAEPFGSPPKRAGQYVLYFGRCLTDDSMGFIFAAPYAARKCLDLVFEGDKEVLWDDDASEGVAHPGTTIVGMTSRIWASTRFYPKTMEEIVGHRYSIAELGWQLPTWYAREILAFRQGLPERPPSPAKKRVTGRRPSREGLTPIVSIAEELGITPREARGALRDMRTPKPPQGWAFPPDQVETIKSSIAAHLGINIP